MYSSNYYFGWDGQQANALNTNKSYDWITLRYTINRHSPIDWLETSWLHTVNVGTVGSKEWSELKGLRHGQRRNGKRQLERDAFSRKISVGSYGNGAKSTCRSKNIGTGPTDWRASRAGRAVLRDFPSWCLTNRGPKVRGKRTASRRVTAISRSQTAVDGAVRTTLRTNPGTADSTLVNVHIDRIRRLGKPSWNAATSLSLTVSSQQKHDVIVVGNDFFSIICFFFFISIW